MSESTRLEINWLNSLGGALGAVSAAVLLSSLGAAGTLLGAALGSLCITVGGAFYAHSLRVAKQRVAAAQALAARRGRSRVRATPSSPEGPEGPESPEEPDTEALAAAAEELPARSRLDVLRELPWKRIVVVSSALFAVAMTAIVAFELATGRPVSDITGGTSGTGGTSVPGLGGRETGEEAPGDEVTEPTPSVEDEAPVEEDEEELPAEESPAPVEETTAPPVEPTAPAETAAP